VSERERERERERESERGGERKSLSAVHRAKTAALGSLPTRDSGLLFRIN